MTKTYIINLIGGPGIGKSTLSALIYAKLKINKNKYTVEYVQEYAKQLVWMQEFDILNNQYYVTQRQYKLLKQMTGKVDFVITDGPIIQGLYYNLHNQDNISDKDKTQQFILQSNSQFNNINIFLNRGPYEYESQGRLQSEEEAKEIDVILKHLLKQNNVEFKIFEANSNDNNIDQTIDYIIDYTNK